ncbi:MAG TPA: class I SAM-dependent methyltransferase [Nevskiaceae bacterium]|nr:class I SAM-dependent methyltransferase [Nevskiaceae bacterium]
MTQKPGAEGDKLFAGSIPKLYEEHLVPLIFQDYAADIVKRLTAAKPLGRILEIAAGTGVVTRAMAAALPETTIVATDLNQAMLDEARSVSAPKNVEWRQADAQQLPFDDGMFDAVVCQYGVMFFPDRVKAFSEARRVLKAGGLYLFNVWDRLADNEFADVISQALATHFPADPPGFLGRTPYGYHDPDRIRRDLAEGGFTKPAQIDTVAFRSRASAARIPSIAYCQGTPLRAELDGRGPGKLEEGTAVATEAIARRFGNGAVDAKIQALVVSIRS